MDQIEDPRELERQIDHATRIASRINDQTTVERLRAWIEELRQRLQVAWKRDAQDRRSVHAPGRFGNRTDALQAATWIFGFRPSPK